MINTTFPETHSFQTAPSPGFSTLVFYLMLYLRTNLFVLNSLSTRYNSANTNRGCQTGAMSSLSLPLHVKVKITSCLSTVAGKELNGGNGFFYPRLEAQSLQPTVQRYTIRTTHPLCMIQPRSLLKSISTAALRSRISEKRWVVHSEKQDRTAPAVWIAGRGLVTSTQVSLTHQEILYWPSIKRGPLCSLRNKVDPTLGWSTQIMCLKTVSSFTFHVKGQLLNRNKGTKPSILDRIPRTTSKADSRYISHNHSAHWQLRPLMQDGLQTSPPVITGRSFLSLPLPPNPQSPRSIVLLHYVKGENDNSTCDTLITAAIVRPISTTQADYLATSFLKIPNHFHKSTLILFSGHLLLENSNVVNQIAVWVFVGGSTPTVHCQWPEYRTCLFRVEPVSNVGWRRGWCDLT